MTEPPKLTARARKWLADMDAAGKPPSPEYADCPRGIVTEMEAAGLIEVWREVGHERGRWATVLLTDAGWGEAHRLNVARRRARLGDQANVVGRWSGPVTGGQLDLT